MSTEKIDLSLDDIIKNDRRQKQLAKIAAVRASGRGGVRGVVRSRGGVSGVVRSRGGRGARRGVVSTRGKGLSTPGVSPLNRNNVASRRGRGGGQMGVVATRVFRRGQGSGVRGRGGRGGGQRGRGGGQRGRGGGQRGRGGNLDQQNRRNNRELQGNRQQLQKKQAFDKLNKAKNILRQKQQQQRQNKFNQGRVGLQSQGQQKKLSYGGMQSDLIVMTQQKKKQKRRWGQVSNLQRSDSVMTISVDNTGNSGSSDVQISMPKRKPQLNRRRNNSLTSSNNDLFNVTVTSPLNKSPRGQGRRRGGRQGNQLQEVIVTSQQDNQTSRGQGRRRGGRRGNQVQDVIVISEQQNQSPRGQGRARGQGRGRGQDRRRGGGRQGGLNQGHLNQVQSGQIRKKINRNSQLNINRGVHQVIRSRQDTEELTTLQKQIKNLEPTVRQNYDFNRQDFVKAKTSMSINERFSQNLEPQSPSGYSQNVQYSSSVLQSSSPGGRQVFF